MSEGAMTRLAAMLPDIDYDLCVLTGDYRAQTFGAYEPALAGMEKICSLLKRPIYGVLGNHDTIRMVPGLEDMGIRMLLNENNAIKRGNQQIYLAGMMMHTSIASIILRGGVRDSGRGVLNPAVAYAGGLSAGFLC
jgi:hypothetical protein